GRCHAWPSYVSYLFIVRRPPTPTLFPTRRSSDLRDLQATAEAEAADACDRRLRIVGEQRPLCGALPGVVLGSRGVVPALLELARSEEHTSELQSRSDLVCRLLLEKKNTFTDTLAV